MSCSTYQREDSESSDMIEWGLVTKYNSLIVYHYHEDKKEPNPAKQRRAMRRCRAVLQSVADRAQPTIWNRSSGGATFQAQ